MQHNSSLNAAKLKLPQIQAPRQNPAQNQRMANLQNLLEAMEGKLQKHQNAIKNTLFDGELVYKKADKLTAMRQKHIRGLQSDIKDLKAQIANGGKKPEKTSLPKLF